MNYVNARASVFSLLLVAGLLLIPLSCAENSPVDPETVDIECNTGNYNIASIEFDERYHYFATNIPLDFNFPHDTNGIVLTEIDGVYYYHPYTIIRRGLMYISGYYNTGDSAYLDLARTYSNKLLELATRANGGIYMKYNFNWRLHTPFSDFMMAPWYSGVAQGLALNFYSKYYEVTGDQYIKAIADSVFNTFTFIDTSAAIWTAAVDLNGYYWVEEYPFKPFDHVFGGYTNAILGLFNYYQISDNSLCEKLLRASLLTINDHFDEYRNPGDVAYYCLLHKVQYGEYQDLYVRRLRFLALIADDITFDMYADSLAADY